MIEFFKTTTRFIISCETWADCEWDVERKYEKNKYEKNEYEKNVSDVNVIDVDVDDVDVDDVDDVDDANNVDNVDDANDVDDVDDVDVDVDSTIIENEKKNDERENECEIWSIENKIEKCELYWFIDQKMHVNFSRNSINRFFDLNDVNDDVVIDSMKVDWVEIIRKLITSTSHFNFVRFTSTHDAHLAKWLSIQ